MGTYQIQRGYGATILDTFMQLCLSVCLSVNSMQFAFTHSMSGVCKNTLITDVELILHTGKP